MEVLDEPFAFAAQHAFFPPDVFGFQGHSDPQEVEWAMTLRASLLLREKYPMSLALVVPAHERGRYIFSASV